MASSPSRDAARAAFDQLDTQEKSAFIFEATFNTIGQALEETGRRVSDIVTSFDVDDLFTPPEAPAPPKAPAAPKAARKKSAPRKKPAPRAKTTPPPSKTAGKKKPDDDA